MDDRMGVYRLTNIANGKNYVGGTTKLLHRKDQHFSDLRHFRHRDRDLQSDYNRYGRSWFEFIVLEFVENVDDLIPAEQRWIDRLKPEYNQDLVAGFHIGDYIRTPEAKKKRHETMTGRKWSPERRAKMEEYLRQRWTGCSNPSKRSFSDERRKKMSEIMMGEKNPNYGKPFSDERKRKIGDANAHHYEGFVSPDGIIYRDIHNLSAFCREHDLVISKMALVAKGRRPHHKGWKRLNESV